MNKYGMRIYIYNLGRPLIGDILFFFFLSCKGLLRQLVATVLAHQPGEFSEHIQQNITNVGTGEIVEI